MSFRCHRHVCTVCKKNHRSVSLYVYEINVKKSHKCVLIEDHQYMKQLSVNPTSSRYTAVCQQTRTVKVPTPLPCGTSYVNRSPLDLLSSSSHGACPTTSAGCTTRIVSPVIKRPTTGCMRHVFSRGVTKPKIPETATICCRTFLEN
jgi:hypothetical protein